jgi:hypothetical protein
MKSQKGSKIAPADSDWLYVLRNANWVGQQYNHIPIDDRPSVNSGYVPILTIQPYHYLSIDCFRCSSAIRVNHRSKAVLIIDCGVLCSARRNHKFPHIIQSNRDRDCGVFKPGISYRILGTALLCLLKNNTTSMSTDILLFAWYTSGAVYKAHCLCIAFPHIIGNPIWPKDGFRICCIDYGCGSRWRTICRGTSGAASRSTPKLAGQKHTAWI